MLRSFCPAMNHKPAHLIIPAAGLGTRMRTVSGSTPKEILQLGGKPAILFAVEEGVSAGINSFVIIISRAKEIIREFFESPDFSKDPFPVIASRLREFRGKCRFTFF